jgi:hypothetical protein
MPPIGPETSQELAIGEKVSPFEFAVVVANKQIESIDWNDDADIVLKTAVSALFLVSDPTIAGLVPDTARFLNKEVYDRVSGRTYHDFLRDVGEVVALELRQATKFITNHDLSAHQIQVEFERYTHTDTLLSVLLFLTTHKPCCRLTRIAWLIPKLGTITSIIPLISYAAVRFAELMNDPLDPYRPCCTPVGNSWLHRLAIYIMHHCTEANVPPPSDLTELFSIVTLPSSDSTKQGKGRRMFQALLHPPQPTYLHEAPEGIAIGNQLALELLGEMDANRQDQYYRRVERAVTRYAAGRFGGDTASIKRIQVASGLSWADAKSLVGSHSFSRLVFNYQCRHLIASEHTKDCPDCQRLRAEMMNQLNHGAQIPSSV